MKIRASRRFRYWLVNFVAGNPSAAKSFLLRGWIFVTLVVMTVPWGVAREITYGRSGDKPDLKASLRSMLWLWNRSWIPVRHPLVTYFDIGWILSEESCEVLCRKGFLSKDPLKRRCDRAQFKLSAIRTGVEAGDQAKLARVDGEIQSLVGDVFNEAYRWAGAAGDTAVRPGRSAPPKPGAADGGGKDFDNASTRAALLDFDDLCARLGQRYFLISGTFLGVVRDGAFIGHDHDIDLGVFEDKLLDGLIPALQDSNDFVITKEDRICMRQADAGGVRYWVMDKPALIKMIHSSGIAIDVFVHFYDGDMAWHGSGIHRWNNKRFALKDYAFLGRSFKGAADFDLYLRENYGAGWRVPQADFDSSVDTPNISFVGSANSLVFWAWMVARAVSEGSAVRVRKYIDMLTAIGVLENRDGRIRIAQAGFEPDRS
jgi:hypothetical protein